ncbi:GlsB/YeaQ/YmgE family stress response membrane protein [Spirosoma areae]
MGFLYSILIGGLAGFIASRIMDSHNSMLVNILLGIVGGFLGGFIARRLGNDPDNDGLVMNLLIAVGGAVLLIFLGRLF